MVVIAPRRLSLLRNAWADAEPALSFALVVAAALLGALAVCATRAPPLYTLDPCASRWRNAKNALQGTIVLFGGLYVGTAPSGALEAPLQRWARPEWRAYAVAKTLALLIVWAWNREDAKNRDAVYGSLARYDAVWRRFFVLYAAALASTLYAFGAWWHTALVSTASIVAASVLLLIQARFWKARV